MRVARVLALITLSVVALVSGAHAADLVGKQMHVRVVAARQSGSTDASLADVLPVLRKNLRFESYTLKGSGRLAIATGSRARVIGLEVVIHDVAGRTVDVGVARGTQQIIKTRLVLVPGKPVLLGGLADADGSTLILVLDVKNPRE